MRQRLLHILGVPRPDEEKLGRGQQLLDMVQLKRTGFPDELTIPEALEQSLMDRDFLPFRLVLYLPRS
ncbi:MAG TPA: hypothetical protein VFO10_02510 [Oligoflexus sp.]|uniref:hypothetical protein n=1 Tax=Oligoflexus sp. TaxID=1971216 RepID=UPI002D7F2662|nr:hypothetical protein [Oligoflexus sp.]HET9236093.1 hypothetical protein [Oligoflexus sp.]